MDRAPRLGLGNTLDISCSVFHYSSPWIAENGSLYRVYQIRQVGLFLIAALTSISEHVSRFPSPSLTTPTTPLSRSTGSGFHDSKYIQPPKEEPKNDGGYLSQNGGWNAEGLGGRAFAPNPTPNAGHIFSQVRKIQKRSYSTHDSSILSIVDN